MTFSSSTSGRAPAVGSSTSQLLPFGSNALGSSSGSVQTPTRQAAAASGTDPLDSPQRSARIGDSIPIVFCRRVGNVGGVLVSPPATEARFSNGLTNAVTARYRFVISEGQIGNIQVRDVFQQSCRVGVFTQRYDGPAGDWAPGNFIVPRAGYTTPEASIFCGTGGTYQGLTTGSFRVTIPNGFDQWNRQVHIFIRNGTYVQRYIEGTVGSSNNICDLFRYLVQQTSRVGDALIDHDANEAAAQFVADNELYCDIELRDAVNLDDWLEGILPYFLLRRSKRGGKIGLRPLLPVDLNGQIRTTPVSWVYRFTIDDINLDSFQITYISRVDRQPFVAQMLWRQQPDNALGLARSSEVRFTADIEKPIEQHDISTFCTNEIHALRAGAYVVSKRRRVEHTVRVDVKPGAYSGSLSNGDIVRLTLNADASFGTPIQHDYLYEVEDVQNNADGSITLELTHFPIDSEGRSLVAIDVASARATGQLMPTGRANVNCDLNSSANSNPWPEEDPGPTPELPPEPESLYPDEFEDWEYDEEEDDWTYIGDRSDEWEWNNETGEWVYIGDRSDEWEWDDEADEWVYIGDQADEWQWDDVAGRWVYIGDPIEDWVWDEDAQEWIYTGDEVPPPAAPAGPPAAPAEPPPPGPPINPPGPPEEEPFPIDPPEPETYEALVSFGTPIVRYPDVFYAVLDPNFTRVTLPVQVDESPVGINAQVRLSNAGEAATVTMPVDETNTVAIMRGSGTSLSGTTTRTVSIVEAGGGSYTDIDTTATQTYEIRGYQGQISLVTFTWTRDNDEWVPAAEPEGWEWDATNVRWDWVGDAVEDWSWDEPNQEWDWTGGGDPSGRPALPPAIPSSLPGGSDDLTVVVRAAVSQVPVGGPADDLEIDINDVFTDGGGVVRNIAKGTITIEAKSAYVGSWRYNFATEEWDYPAAYTSLWQWSPTEADWVWVGVGAPVGTAPVLTPPANPPWQDWENTRASVGELTYHVNLP